MSINKKRLVPTVKQLNNIHFSIIIIDAFICSSLYVAASKGRYFLRVQITTLTFHCWGHGHGAVDLGAVTGGRGDSGVVGCDGVVGGGGGVIFGSVC